MLKKIIKEIIYPLMKSLPDFLIIGAQKAGTTSLYNYLIQHPKIIPSRWKEIHYFSSINNYQNGISWYLEKFPSRFEKGNKLTLDSTPHYLNYAHAPQLIKQDLGEIKMIAILRNPVDRAYSAWKMYHYVRKQTNLTGNIPNEAKTLKKLEDTRSFAKAIEQELNHTCMKYNYIQSGKYYEHLKNYYHYFEKDNILILNFDNLKKDLVSTLSITCDFLQIDPFPAEILQSLQGKKYNVGIKKQLISPQEEEVLKLLKNYFEPFNQELYNLLGYSFNW